LKPRLCRDALSPDNSNKRLAARASGKAEPLELDNSKMSDRVPTAAQHRRHDREYFSDDVKNSCYAHEKSSP
jgi:hypothetical protein